MSALFPSRLLFTVTADVPRLAEAALPPEQWPAESLLPPLAELDGETAFAQLRVAWDRAGLYVAVTVPHAGPLLGNRKRPTSGDSLLLWLDTRPGTAPLTPGPCCHNFVALPAQPAGGGPVAWEQALRRAAEQPLAAPGDLAVRLARGEDSYTLRLDLPAAVLPGFTARRGQVLGCEYLVTDTTHGSQSWATPRHSAAPPLPGRMPGGGGYLRLC